MLFWGIFKTDASSAFLSNFSMLSSDDLSCTETYSSESILVLLFTMNTSLTLDCDSLLSDSSLIGYYVVFENNNNKSIVSILSIL